MKTATVSELRNNFDRIESWLDSGEQVEINRRGKRYVMASQPEKNAEQKFKMPNWRAQLKEIWGDRPPFEGCMVLEARARERC